MTRRIVVPRHWAACSHAIVYNHPRLPPIEGRLLRHPPPTFINTALGGIFQFFVDSFDFLARRLQLKDVFGSS